MTSKAELFEALSQDSEALHCFLIQLGSLALRSVPAAAFARHTNPLDAVRDYLDVPEKGHLPLVLAAEFWKDLVNRRANTEHLSRKWFGQTAKELAGQQAQLLDEDRSREDLK